MSEIDRMPDFAFRAMSWIMELQDRFSSKIDRRVTTFGIETGMTVVDYGCGPGRYTVRFARLVGAMGKVYAIDVQELALAAVRRKAASLSLANITPVLVNSYDTGLPEGCADVVCAIDMFHGISAPTTFLQEVHRLTKPDGYLILDSGHQPHAAALKKIQASGCWQVVADTPDHFKCQPA